MAGTVLVAAAYFPQIVHLIGERCSAGISRRAFAMWFLAAFLLLAHAVAISDWIFIALQGFNTAATGVILVFARRYRHHVCSSHAPPSFRPQGFAVSGNRFLLPRRG